MAGGPWGRNIITVVGLIIVVLFTPDVVLGKRPKKVYRGHKLNVIDECWRLNPDWQRHREQLASCSVGFAGKMTNNMGWGVKHYVVTDPSDHPLYPKPGTLRYGASRPGGTVWITFQRDMRIKLEKPLLVSNFTAIDGRGASVHIAGGACILLYQVHSVIIHGVRIHHCKPQTPGPVMGTDSKPVQLNALDGDAITLIGSSKVWIDHNTLYECHDGLIDVTAASTNITISNNWFRNHDKVMLLGHDDEFQRDRKMKVTVVFNHFGPKCLQRMPRVRHGYAHVVNNLYKGWEQYAIGGSMNPNVKSEANLFIAPKAGNKEVTWRQDAHKEGRSWNFHSVRDIFENGAHFKQTRQGHDLKPHYNPQQAFRVADAGNVRSLTRQSGALRCSKTRPRC